MNRSIKFWLTAGVLLCTSMLWAQSESRLSTERMGAAAAQFSSWSVEGDRVAQAAFPMTYRMPIAREGQLYVSTAPAFSGLKQDSLSHSLSGMSDIRIGGNTFLFNENWLLTFGLNLPTGKHALNTEEFMVWRELIQPILHFPVSAYGQGLDVNLGISTARASGQWMLGAGIAYLYKGTFKPLDGFDIEYNAGDEIILTLGAQRDNFITDLMVTWYGKDQVGGADVFQSGLSLLLQVAATWDFDPWMLRVMARDQYKLKNKVPGASGFITERISLNANQFELVARGSRLMNANMTLHVSWTFRLYADNELDYGGAALTGPGMGLDLPLSDKFTLNSMLSMMFGKINTLSGSFSASGLTGMAGLTVQL